MTICSVAGRVGATYVTGTAAGMDPETFAHSKLILLWGTNTLTSGHHLWKFILAARKNGAHIVAIDPLRTRTAAQADEHLAPLPGTDAALALGLLHVIVSMDAAGRRVPGRAHRRLGGVQGADPRVPAVARGRDHRPRRGHDRRARAPDRDHAPDRHPLHDGHAAPRRRRQRAAAAVRAAGRDRRLAVPGRRRVVLDQRALRSPIVDAIFRDDLLQRPCAR